MASVKEKEMEFADYPKIKEAYIKAFDRMLKKHDIKSSKYDWGDGQAVFDWWLYGDKKQDLDTNQLSLQDMIDDLYVED